LRQSAPEYYLGSSQSNFVELTSDVATAPNRRYGWRALARLCVCVQFAEAAKTVTNRPVVNLTSDNTADPVIQDLRKQLSEMNDRNQSLQVLQQLFPSRTLQLVQLVELYGVVVVGTPCGLGGVVE